jgi:hypothetical protein
MSSVSAHPLVRPRPRSHAPRQNVVWGDHTGGPSSAGVLRLHSVASSPFGVGAQQRPPPDTHHRAQAWEGGGILLEPCQRHGSAPAPSSPLQAWANSLSDVYQQLVHTWNALPAEFRRRVRTSIHVAVNNLLVQDDPTPLPTLANEPTPYDADELRRIMAEPKPVATLPPRPDGPLVVEPADEPHHPHSPGVREDTASVAAGTQAAADGSGGDAGGSSGGDGRNAEGVVDRGASPPATLVRYLFSRDFSPADRCLSQPSPSLPPADESFSAVREEYCGESSDLAGPDDDPAGSDDLTDPDNLTDLDDVVPPGRRLRPRH